MRSTTKKQSSGTDLLPSKDMQTPKIILEPYTSMGMAFLKTIMRRLTGIVGLPNRGVPQRNSTLASAMTALKAFRWITKRQSSGTD